MTTLVLTSVWLNRMDTGEGISVPSAGRTRQTGVEGRVTTAAGGRRRAISQAGQLQTYAFTLLSITHTTMVKLESWLGIAVQLRDHRGQRFVGTFFELTSVEPSLDPNEFNATMTLQVVSTEDLGV